MIDVNARTINIRTIQHYMYCPRRWGLLEINNDWVENAFVVKADIMHGRVHDGSHSFSDKNKTVRSSIALYNDLPEYDLFGIADCVEFVKVKNGIKVKGLPDSYAMLNISQSLQRIAIIIRQMRYRYLHKKYVPTTYGEAMQNVLCIIRIPKNVCVCHLTVCLNIMTVF